MKARWLILPAMFIAFHGIAFANPQEDLKRESSTQLKVSGNESAKELRDLLAQNPAQKAQLVPALETALARQMKIPGKRILLPQVKVGVTAPFSGTIVVHPKRTGESMASLDIRGSWIASMPRFANFPPLTFHYDEKETRKYLGSLSFVEGKGLVLEYDGDKLQPFINNSSGTISLGIYQEEGNNWTDISKLFLPSAVGSIYRFQGKVELFNCTFLGEGDETNRLTFQITEHGFAYLRGKGKVIFTGGIEKKFGME